MHKQPRRYLSDRSFVMEDFNWTFFKQFLVGFLAQLSTECSLSYCDHSPSIGVRPSAERPSIHNFLVNTLASTNIYQSAPNLVKMYMTIRSQMRSVMELIGPELSELSALELENLPYFTVDTLASANIDQSVPNLATIYMLIRSRMRLFMGQIESEHPELFALEFGKIAEYDFVYTLSSTNIDQSAPNLVKMYGNIRSQMSSIMHLIGPELSKLSARELENLPHLTLFTI